MPEHHQEVTDLNFREIAALAPLVVFIFWIGLRPGDFVRPTAATLNQATAAVLGKVGEPTPETHRLNLGRAETNIKLLQTQLPAPSP